MSSTDPLLGLLTAGSPEYFPLYGGRPAIDAGDHTLCAAAPVDNTSQNGVTRPADGDGNSTSVCDIGSYEAPVPSPVAYEVNTTADNTTDDAFCTLREAINAANNAVGSNGDCGALSSGDDTITFDINSTITLSSQLPAILSGRGTLSIDGGGHTISGNNAVRVFYVNAGATLNIQNITIANGNAATDSYGGGILNEGTLTITNSTFSGNTGGDQGGGLYNSETGTV